MPREIQTLRFAHLRKLVIRGEWSNVSQMIYMFSRWELPLIQSLHLSGLTNHGPQTTELETLLWHLENSLRVLVCDAFENQLPPLWTVLKLCPKLTSLSFPWPSSFLRPFDYSHERLANIKLLRYTLASSSEPEYTDGELQNLRQQVLKLCPKIDATTFSVRDAFSKLQWAGSIDIRNGTTIKRTSKQINVAQANPALSRHHQRNVRFVT